MIVIFNYKNGVDLLTDVCLVIRGDFAQYSENIMKSEIEYHI